MDEWIRDSGYKKNLQKDIRVGKHKVKRISHY